MKKEIHTLEIGDLIRLNKKGLSWTINYVDKIDFFDGTANIICPEFDETDLYNDLGFNATLFLDFIRKEAKKKLEWFRNSEATKYTKPFEVIFGKGRFSWCAAFVHWCLNNYDYQSGLSLPIKIPGHEYTLALCEEWEIWAKEKGWYIPVVNGKPVKKALPGDLVLFDWDFNEWGDHIGVLLKFQDKSECFLCAEGNVSNATAFRIRKWQFVNGLIRIPTGWCYHN